MSSTGIYCDFGNDNTYSKDASFNNVSILNNLKINTLTTDKTRILNDGSLETYFAGTPALPLKGGNSWWGVQNELEELNIH